MVPGYSVMSKSLSRSRTLAALCLGGSNFSLADVRNRMGWITHYLSEFLSFMMYLMCVDVV